MGIPINLLLLLLLYIFNQIFTWYIYCYEVNKNPGFDEQSSLKKNVSINYIKLYMRNCLNAYQIKTHNLTFVLVFNNKQRRFQRNSLPKKSQVLWVCKRAILVLTQLKLSILYHVSLLSPACRPPSFFDKRCKRLGPTK